MSRDNTATAGTGIVRADLAAEMRAYDTLPAPVRQLLAAAHGKWSALQVQRLVQQAQFLSNNPSRFVADHLGHSEHVEIAGFSQLHVQQHGYPLPHLAAAASIQRP
jgi:hypothetical protein